MQPRAAEMMPHLKQHDPTVLSAELFQLQVSQSTEVLRGMQRLATIETDLPPEPGPVIWQQGSSTLHDYGQEEENGTAPLVFCVPSLINRAYILDLTEAQSFIRHLKREGMHPLLLDWGVPGQDEKRFGCGAYILRRLIPALEEARRRYPNRPLVLTGYCMGGLLAMAAAQAQPDLVDALTLLATPWDFHAPERRLPGLGDEARHWFDDWVSGADYFPAEWMQMLFCLLDPWGIQEKYRDFSRMEEGAAEAQDFAVLEGWVNDGVPLTTPVARECLIGWGMDNVLVLGRWMPLGESVAPQEISIPTLLVIPAKDRIVPPESTAPLIDTLPDVSIARPDAGHVGMMVGTHAQRELWDPVVCWISQQLSAG